MRISEKLEQVRSILEMELQILVVIGHLPADKDAMALRPMPSGNINYYTGQRSIPFTFQLLNKAEKQENAMKILEIAIDRLILEGCIVYTEPNFLSYDEQGYIYTASLTIDL